MTTLGIDTSTNFGSVGLVTGEKLNGEFTFHAVESQSERLLANLDTLIDRTEVELSDINKVAVSIGPGSFTGLRIGISSAKGIAHGLNVPLVGVKLTDCYYSRVEHYPGPVCAVISDRRNLVYCAAFNSRAEKVLTEESTSIESLREKLKDRFKDKMVLMVGDGLTDHWREFDKWDNIKLAEDDLNFPSGSQVGFLGESMDREIDELQTIEPLYAQRPIAEINWNKNNKGD